MPGDVLQQLRGHTIPPFVDQISREVKRWRDAGFPGASDTTQALMRYWLCTGHVIPGTDGGTICRDLRLAGDHDILFGKLKRYIEERPFVTPVSLDDPKVLCNLSEPEALKAIFATSRDAICAPTVVDLGRTEVRELPRPLRRHRLVREARREHRFQDRVQQHRRQHLELLPRLPGEGGRSQVPGCGVRW